MVYSFPHVFPQSLKGIGTISHPACRQVFVCTREVRINGHMVKVGYARRILIIPKQLHIGSSVLIIPLPHFILWIATKTTHYIPREKWNADWARCSCDYILPQTHGRTQPDREHLVLMQRAWTCPSSDWWCDIILDVKFPIKRDCLLNIFALDLFWRQSWSRTWKPSRSHSTHKH